MTTITLGSRIPGLVLAHTCNFFLPKTSLTVSCLSYHFWPYKGHSECCVLCEWFEHIEFVLPVAFWEDILGLWIVVASVPKHFLGLLILYWRIDCWFYGKLSTCLYFHRTLPFLLLLSSSRRLVLPDRIVLLAPASSCSLHSKFLDRIRLRWTLSPTALHTTTYHVSSSNLARNSVWIRSWTWPTALHVSLERRIYQTIGWKLASEPGSVFLNLTREVMS